jgi:excisionase family DNA binding protein
VGELEDAIRQIVRSELDAGGTRRRLYTVKAAAEFLGVSESLIRKKIRLGKIKVEKIDGWAVRIPVEELQRLLREGRE